MLFNDFGVGRKLGSLCYDGACSALGAPSEQQHSPKTFKKFYRRANLHKKAKISPVHVHGLSRIIKIRRIFFVNLEPGIYKINLKILINHFVWTTCLPWSQTIRKPYHFKFWIPTDIIKISYQQFSTLISRLSVISSVVWSPAEKIKIQFFSQKKDDRNIL